MSPLPQDYMGILLSILMEKAMAPHSNTLATSCEELTHWKRL